MIFFFKNLLKKAQLFSSGILFSIFLLSGCMHAPVKQERELSCMDYPAWQNSAYILPFIPGETYPLVQGNCESETDPWTHFGKLRFAYDFGMPIGTRIIAVKSGTVVFVRDHFTDEDHQKDQGNAVVLIQEDGALALYAHITYRGAAVKVGQPVKQGEVIALSGNSGESPMPHLHFQVNECGDFINCSSIPVAFNNAIPHTNRLEKGKEYRAALPIALNRLCPGINLIDLFPIDDFKEGLDIFRPPVLVFEIIGMLPYIQPKDRNFSET
jgi:murein DD-endopeptidase MepM/ murein hydrolase activator NlpD